MSVTYSLLSPSLQHDLLPHRSFNSQVLERVKLVLRANKYKTKEDRGGIACLLQSIKPGDTVFDIGAHKGGYLYFMRRMAGKTGRVYAFEPQRSLYQYLKRTRELLNWSNVIIEPYAISNDQGEAILYVPYNHGQMSSPGATIIEQVLKNSTHRTETVDTISLDLYCLCNNVKPSFLKIDVEGNELNIFKGARHLLKSHKPRILFECEARHVGKQTLFETFRCLEQLGYRGRFICGDRPLPLSAFSVEKFQDKASDVYCNNFIFE